MKLVQQYGRLNTLTMVIIVLIFITMDMQTFYQCSSQVLLVDRAQSRPLTASGLEFYDCFIRVY